MSGIAGVWNLDGRPIERQLITTIASRVAHRGRDRCGVWSDTCVGFASHVRNNSPADVDERQPLTDVAGNAIAFDGRLDNRQDLLRQLRTRGLTADSSDAAFVLEAFHMWGRDGFSRLEGEFALALFDSPGRQLTLARDPVGCRPLYYWSDGQTLVFASEIKAILAHPAVRTKANEDLLADYFLREHLPYDDCGATFFDDVHAVLPGRRVSVSPGRMTSEGFWDFNPQSVVRFRSYAEYAERLRELLVQAVNRRLRTPHPVAIAVSGGLDSSVVLCIADDLRKSGAVSAPLLPISVVPNDDRATEETQFIALLETTRRIHIHRVQMGGPGPAVDLETAAWHSESPRFDDGWCAHRPMFAWAHANGAGTMLTGHWSDQLFFVTGYLSDLFTRFAWKEISSHLAEYPRWFVDADPAYFSSRFRRELTRNLSWPRLRAALAPVIRGRTAGARGHLLDPRWGPRARRSRARTARSRSASAHARDIYQLVRSQSHRLQFESDAKLVATCELDATTPFLDRDVIAYLMSIPGEVQNRDGVPRALLRDAMRGIIPDEIRLRRWRNHDAPVLARHNVYISSKERLESAYRLGFFTQPLVVEPSTLELIGLEMWSRAFFSDRLTPPQPSHNEAGEAMDTRVTPQPEDREKLPYSPPKLTIHGDLRSLTAAKQSDRTEAGQPKTFNSGMP